MKSSRIAHSSADCTDRSYKQHTHSITWLPSSKQQLPCCQLQLDCTSAAPQQKLLQQADQQHARTLHHTENSTPSSRVLTPPPLYPGTTSSKSAAHAAIAVRAAYKTGQPFGQRLCTTEPSTNATWVPSHRSSEAPPILVTLLSNPAAPQASPQQAIATSKSFSRDGHLHTYSYTAPQSRTADPSPRGQAAPTSAFPLPAAAAGGPPHPPPRRSAAPRSPEPCGARTAFAAPVHLPLPCR